MPVSTLQDIDICSAALIKIGAKSIQSMTDGSREAQVASTLYPRVFASELAGYPWQFAAKELELNQLVAVEIDPLWTYSYALPQDLLAVRRVYDSSGQISGHRVEGGVVLSNDPQLFMEYTAITPEGLLPEYFTDLLIARCAWEFSRPISGVQSDITDVSRDYQAKRTLARGVDARSNLPNVLIEPRNSSLIRARGGRAGYYL